MKKYLLTLLLGILSLPIFAQQKISGTVTYFFNEYQGNKADVGAQIFCIDSLNANIKTMDEEYIGQSLMPQKMT